MRARRRLLLLVIPVLVAGRASRAQSKPRRIGCLFGGSPNTHARALEALREGLRERGWIEGRGMTLDVRWVEGRMSRVPAMAADLVASRPDVIVTAAVPIVRELAKATKTIPIVMATGSDPVGSGLVASLARPGGNVTGLSGFFEATPTKMLELAAELIGRGGQVAALVELNTPFAGARYRSAFIEMAGTLDRRVQLLDVARPEDVVRVLDELREKPPAALVVLPGPMLFALGKDLVRSAQRLAVPVVYPFEEMVEAGGLASYSADLVDSYRRAGGYVDRILRGANPADLPIEQPTQLRLAVNLATARAQKVHIPQSIVQRADRVIE